MDATSKPAVQRPAAGLRRLLAAALSALALLVLAPAAALADGEIPSPAPGLDVAAVDPPADSPPVDPPPGDEAPPVDPPPDPVPVDPPPVDPAPPPVDPPPPDPAPVDPAPIDPVPVPLDPPSAPDPEPSPAPGRVSERAAVAPATAPAAELLPLAPADPSAAELPTAAEPAAAEDEAKPKTAVGTAAPARAFRTALSRLGITPLPSVAHLQYDADADSGACAVFAPVAAADPGGTTGVAAHDEAPARREVQGTPEPRGPPRPFDPSTAPVAAGAAAGAATAAATVAWVVELAGAVAITPCSTAAFAATCVAGPAGTVAGCHAARAPPTA